jgi:hypothetical protein
MSQALWQNPVDFGQNPLSKIVQSADLASAWERWRLAGVLPTSNIGIVSTDRP